MFTFYDYTIYLSMQCNADLLPTYLRYLEEGVGDVALFIPGAFRSRTTATYRSRYFPRPSSFSLKSSVSDLDPGGSGYFDNLGSGSGKIPDPYPDPECVGKRTFLFKFNILFFSFRCCTHLDVL